MSKTNWIKRAISRMLIAAMVLSTVVTNSLVGFAAIAATDHFTLTAAGDATTMDAGGTLVFTIKAYDGSNTPKAFIGGDKICVDIMNSATFGPSTTADITAKGDGLTITDYSAGGSVPYPLTSGSDLSGTNTNAVCFTAATGDSASNTITVKATSSFNIYAWANGSAINDATGTYPGVDFANITVGSASSGADHLLSDFGSETTAEVGQQKTVTITQVNTGGGVVSSALTDAVIDINSTMISPGSLSSLMESSAAHNFGAYGIVKFTSAAQTSAYYLTSAISATTFKVMGATPNMVYSNSNVTPVSGVADGVAVAVDPGDTITKEVASTVNVSGVTTLVAGDIVSLPGGGAGQCGLGGHFSVVSASNNGADSTVTVIGPIGGSASCVTAAGNITKITLTDGAASAYTVSNGADADGYIYSVGGVATGNETTTVVTGKTLTSGSLSAVVVASEGGTFRVSGFSPTLANPPVADTLTVSAASSLQIKGYGPPIGQVGVPTNAPVDIFLSKNPSGGAVSFPLTNTTSSAISITAGGTAVAGTWQSVQEGIGDTTFYKAVFSPTNVLSSSTLHTVSVLKTLAVGGTDLQGMPALTDSGSAYVYTFTTGSSGGTFTTSAGTAPGGMGGGFTGTFGGDVPPMAMLGYPRPESWDVPTNIAKITVDFDRDMDATTFSNSTIYLKKIVSGAEVAPGVTTTVAPLTGNSKTAYMTISGGTLAANSEYRVVVTREVKDTKGKQIAGMPVSDSGEPLQGFGFGFSNMGPFKQNFHTGSGTSTISASLMGVNLDKYKASGSITGVPTTMRIRASYSNPLDPSTVTSSNVTLKRGSTPVVGTVSYDAQANTVEFIPSSVLLPTTTYTFNISTSVTSVTGSAVSSTTKTFVTGSADSVSPQMVFAEADNYGLKVKYSEAMDDTSVQNKGNYTLKVCSGQMINADGVKCVDNTTDPTTVSVITSNVHFDQFDNTLWIDGLTLTSGDGFYVMAGSSVKDAAANNIDASRDTWIGKIMDAESFQGGQGMSTMTNLEMKDFNMGTMGTTPISVMPMNSMAGASTKYFIRFPVSSVIPTGGYVEFTFPSGFVVTGAKRDAQSPMNADFNGTASGTTTFASNLTSVFPIPTDGAGAQANDGVGYLSGANKVYVKLNGATNASDFLQIDLDGIVNSNEPKDPSTAGYSVQIKIYNTSATVLEAMQSMPFYISQSGSSTVGGRVTASGTGLNGVKVFLFSPFTGPMEATTANNANSGGLDGEYKFSNLPAGQYMISTEPTFTISDTAYTGKMSQEPLIVTGDSTKNFSVTTQDTASNARQPVTITYTQDSLSAIANLGFSDSIDIFAGSQNGFVVKTVARASLTGSSYTTTMYLPNPGNWTVGIGPSMPKGPMAGTPAEIDWMPSQPSNVTIASTDINGSPKSGMTFALTTADKTITGKTVDTSGTAIQNVEVYAYNPKGGMNAHTTSDSTGAFTLNVTEGTYKVGAFIPGMPNSSEVSALVDGSSVYIDGSPTASTGSSGLNPFNIKISKTSITIQGRVSDGSSAIANSAVWAHRTDSPMPPIRTMTDSTGNYTLYVSAGTWKIESDAPGYGYLGSITATVTSTSLTSQDFTVASGQGSISGTVDIAGDDTDSGVIVTAFGSSGINESTTASDGTYKLSVPYGTYTVKVFIPGIGNQAPLTVVVDGDEVGANFTTATPRGFTITLDEAVSDDTLITFNDQNGNGNQLVIPAGSTSGLIQLEGGAYYIETDIPGVEFEDVVVAGAEFNNINGTPSTDNTVEMDGTGDNLTIALPVLYSVSGQVLNGGSGLNDVSVQITDTTSKNSFSVITSNNGAGGALDGEYLVKLPAGTYTILPNKPGYDTTPIDVTISATSTGNNFTLTANSRTVTGSVKVGSTGISGARVYAEGAGGGFETTSTTTDGTYSISVKPGIWTLNAVAEGYSGATAIQVDVTATNDTDKNFTVTALSGGSLLEEPQTESLTPANGGIVTDTATNTEVVVPPNALGSETDPGQMTIAETNEVFDTPSAKPIGNGQEISATDSNGNPITNLDDAVTITLQKTLAELTAEGVDTPLEAGETTLAYWDDTADEWIPESTTLEYYTVGNTLIANATVDASVSLQAAGVSYVKFTAETDHFTTFAPIVSSGATPPATPASLSATAGDGQVVLSWTKNSEEDMLRYDIWESNVTEGVTSTLTQAACTTSPCTKTITGLTNGTAYSFQIIAVDNDGNSSAGSTAAAATPAAASSGGGSSGGGGGSLPTSGKKETKVKDESADTTTENSVTTTTTTTTPLKDIIGHWAQTYIEDLYEKQIVSGMDASHYSPNKPISRAELTKIVVNMYKIPMQPVGSFTSSFKDVKTSEWYAPYIQAAYDKEIIVGFSDKTFNPNKPITRAEAMKIILEASGKDIPAYLEENSEFKDIKLKDWYAKYVIYAAKNGIVNGYEDGTFGPNKPITRAEVAKIASLMLKGNVVSMVLEMMNN